jgi:hypothetical protein
MVKFDMHRYNSEPMSFGNSYMESYRLPPILYPMPITLTRLVLAEKNHVVAIAALSTDTGINSNFTAYKILS